MTSYSAGLEAPSPLLASAVEGNGTNRGTTPSILRVAYKYAATSVSNERNMESNATLALSQTEMTTHPQTVTAPATRYRSHNTNASTKIYASYNNST